MSRGVGLIVGAGTGTGAALARRFAAGGLGLCLVRRDRQALAPLLEELGKTVPRLEGVGADATCEAGVCRIVRDTEHRLGPIQIAVYNVATLIRAPVVELEAALYRQALDIASGAFLIGREVARAMQTRGSGTIIFTSSTASLRGAAGNAALASARFAIRGLAESMARELGPAGIHVVHLVMDGMIDTPALRQAIPDFTRRFPPESLIAPEMVAEQCWQLHRQPRTAWSHQVVLRPWRERW